VARPDKEPRDRYMRSSACLRFGGSGEREEGNSEFIIQHSNCRCPSAHVLCYSPHLNSTARFDGVGAAAKRGYLYPDDLACEPDLPKLPRFVADDVR
jgi:hypothetical protein